MKIFKYFYLVFIFSFFSMFNANAMDGHNLTIIIPNTKSNIGKIQIGLFDKRENFPKPNKQYKTVVINARKNATYTF